MNPSRLALAVFLLAAPSLLAASPDAAPGHVPSGLAPIGAASSYLPITLRCEACREEAPTLSLLWRGGGPEEPSIVRSVTARDWSSGEFILVGENGNVALRGVPVENGWALQVPIADRGLPFRVVAALSGFVADRAAWWPEQERTELSLRLSPIATVLDAHPAWDPARSAECDVLIPKSAETPIVFLEAGQPRAWLFPTPGAVNDEPAWTFQFVRPGASLLERVNVSVVAFDEGDSWALRVPLAAVLSSTTRVSVAGVGILSLADCPRAVR